MHRSWKSEGFGQIFLKVVLWIARKSMWSPIFVVYCIFMTKFFEPSPLSPPSPLGASVLHKDWWSVCLTNLFLFSTFHYQTNVLCWIVIVLTWISYYSESCLLWLLWDPDKPISLIQWANELEIYLRYNRVNCWDWEIRFNLITLNKW